MKEVICVNCGRIIKIKRNKYQIYCGRDVCQRARKRKWEKNKIKEDERYKESRVLSKRKWLDNNAGYYKKYRHRNPENRERNRFKQKIRDLSKKMKLAENKGNNKKNLAKTDALKGLILKCEGVFYIVPLLAKTDAFFMKIPKYNSMLAGLAKTDIIESSKKEMILLKKDKTFIEEKYAEKNFEKREG